MKKRCSKCGRDRELCRFTRNASRKDGLNHACRDCHREYVREHYRANKRYYKDKAKRGRDALYEASVQMVRKAKSVPCADCGETYPYYVMDFDHVRGTKVGEVSRLMQRRVSLDQLRKEIKKCDVVCSNCHRERTHGTTRA
jgi:hypothetical protein